MLAVAALAASAAGIGLAKSTATSRPTRSAAIIGSRSYRPSSSHLISQQSNLAVVPAVAQKEALTLLPLTESGLNRALDLPRGESTSRKKNSKDGRSRTLCACFGGRLLSQEHTLVRKLPRQDSNLHPHV